MRKLKFILLFLLLGGIFSACKKYPDDPFFSLATAKNRLAGDPNGNHWYVVSVYINGVDSTEQFKLNGCGCSMNIAYRMDDGVDFSNCAGTVCGSAFVGWGLDKNKNLIMQGYLVYPQPIVQPNPSQSYVESLTHFILKLYKDELKFKVTHPDNGKEYVFEYKKTENS